MSQTIEIPELTSGLSNATCSIVARSTDALVESGLELSELTNGKSHYRCTATTTASGWHIAVIKAADTSVIGAYWLYLTGTAVIHYASKYLGPGYDSQVSAVPSAPSDPSLSTGYVYCYDESGVAESSVNIKAYMTAGPGSDGYAHDSAEFTFTSDITGLASHAFVRGATYNVRRATGREVKAVVPDAGTFQLPEILGKP